MATTHFSGPVQSTNGFFTVYIVSDNGAGNNEYCLVINTGAAWVTAVGAALS